MNQGVSRPGDDRLKEVRDATLAQDDPEGKKSQNVGRKPALNCKMATSAGSWVTWKPEGLVSG